MHHAWLNIYFSPFTDGLKVGWKILENGGDRWIIEKGHHGSDPLPEEVLALSNNESYNFATSYGWCSMEQIIDLVEEGISEELLDAQPDILVTEW